MTVLVDYSGPNLKHFAHESLSGLSKLTPAPGETPIPGPSGGAARGQASPGLAGQSAEWETGATSLTGGVRWIK